VAVQPADFGCPGAGGMGVLRIFCSGGYSPPQVVVIGEYVYLPGRQHLGFHHTDIIISLLVLVAMSVAVFWYESGHERCGSDFSITLGGIFYLGWLGPYLISLRNCRMGCGGP